MTVIVLFVVYVFYFVILLCSATDQKQGGKRGRTRHITLGLLYCSGGSHRVELGLLHCLAPERYR